MHLSLIQFIFFLENVRRQMKGVRHSTRVEKNGQKLSFSNLYPYIVLNSNEPFSSRNIFDICNEAERVIVQDF